MEEDQNRIYVLQRHLGQGALQAERGEFDNDYSIEKVIEELDAEL